MKHLQRLLHDRRRRQQGSVLSAVLIIVAFLSILLGALLTELTDSFILSRDLQGRVKAEATVTSAVEYGIHQLQGGPVPAVCVRDTRGPWSIQLNGSPASVTQTCEAILPEQTIGLATGSFQFDGVHDTVDGQNRYLVSDSAGRLSSYPFGQSTASWTIGLGGAPTASPLTLDDPNGTLDIVAPVAKAGCGGGHCVVVFNDQGGAPAFRCNLATSAAVSSPAAGDVTAGGGEGNFPGYVFFADANGRLYVYNASSSSCPQLASTLVGGRVVGAPLVFPGTANGNGGSNDEIFIVVTTGGSTELQHWRYSETNGSCEDQCNGDNGNGRGQAGTTSALSRIDSRSLVGGNAVGYAASSIAPSNRAPLTLAVATAAGRLELARISLNGGSSYSMSVGASTILPNGDAASRAPYWCHCPGQDLIGVGGTKGFLYLFNSGLGLASSYDGQADGRPSINTTPMADSMGDWYFGANDGSIYDVEIPVSGSQMFKAARFGPGGPPIASSPIVGACTAGPCLYFGSSINGSYFVRIGGTRVSDLRACISSAANSTSCVANPRLWARVQVGPSAVWGGTGVYVQGWSFYSP